MHGRSSGGKVTSQDKAKPDDTFKTLRRFFPYVWPVGRPDLRLRVVLALLVLAGATIITVVTPFALGGAIDALDAMSGQPGGRPSAALWLTMPIFLTFAYAVGRVMQATLTNLRDSVFAQVGQHAVRELASKTFVHMHNLSLRYHLQRRTGGLARVISRGISGIESIVRFIALMIVPTILQFALSAIAIGQTFAWTYVAIIAGMVVVYVWFSVKASDWRISIRRAMNDSDTDASSKAIDSLLNYETVKYFNNEALEAGRFDKSMARYQVAAVKSWTSLAWLNIGQAVIFSLGMFACMGLSAVGVMDGTLKIGDFGTINAMLIQLAMPLNFIGVVYREIRQGIIDVEAMFSILEIPPEVVDKPNAPPLRVIGGHVRFENVTFAYDPARPILKGISFEVRPGATVALVGPSGAGKSTIARLLFRFYDVTGGAITVDGQDIRDVKQDSLRAAIGMVPQDTVLFNDTIAYNIRYGRPDASEEEVAEAAQTAQIFDFIRSLPDGYKTEVGERGLKLSGGEKQRVAIARTVLKGPPLLMLDEATSALDSHTEREIQVALDRVAAGRTTLVIAHRLSTVIQADEIIVLVDGKIAERGRHSALLAAGGVYAGMWNRQLEAAEAAERLRRAEALARDEASLVAKLAPEPMPAK
ncbi:MAG: ABC transporter ATP-binding protein/permease [Bauldia sp.]